MTAIPNETHGRLMPTPETLWTDGNTAFKVKEVSKANVTTRCCIRGLEYIFGMGDWVERFNPLTTDDIDAMMELMEEV